MLFSDPEWHVLLDWQPCEFRILPRTRNEAGCWWLGSHPLLSVRPNASLASNDRTRPRQPSSYSHFGSERFSASYPLLACLLICSAAPPALSWTDLRAPIPTTSSSPGAALPSRMMPAPQWLPLQASPLGFRNRSHMMSTATSPVRMRLPSRWIKMDNSDPLQIDSGDLVVTVLPGEKLIPYLLRVP